MLSGERGKKITGTACFESSAFSIVLLVALFSILLGHGNAMSGEHVGKGHPAITDSDRAEGLLDLELAMQTALESNPTLRRAKANTQTAKAGVTSAISAFLPRLDLNMTLGRSNNPVFAFGSKLNQADFTMQDFQLDRLNDPDYRTNWNTRFVLTQPIFNRGQEYIGYKISKAGENMATLQEKATVQGLFFSVKQAYLQVLLAKEAMQVMQSALEAARAHEKLAERRYRAGLVLKSDVLSATVQKTSMERDYLSAENNFQVAMAGLNRAMGTPQGTVWKLEPVVQGADPGDEEISQWIERAYASRPELSMSRKKEEIAHYRTKGAKLNFLPAINFSGMYEQDTDNPGKFGGDSWTFMATASFNIFSGLGDRARLSAATAQEQAAREELRETRDRIELEVREAFYNWKTALKQLEVTRAAVEQAQESVRILKNRYDNGMALMVELLSADTMLKNQKLQQARARYDSLLAFARLELSAGVLGAEVLKGKGENVELAEAN